MTNPTIGQPRPLADAANAVTKGLGMVGALVTAAVGYGLLAVAQGDAVQGLLGAIPGLITLIQNFAVAFGIVNRAEPKVTPVSSPRDNDGQPLTVQRSSFRE